MKWIIALKKNGRVRGRVWRNTEEEARKKAEGYRRFGSEYTAEIEPADKIWIALYSGEDGNLLRVVSDAEFDQMERDGVIADMACEVMLVREGRFYETLQEAMEAELIEFLGRVS